MSSLYKKEFAWRILFAKLNNRNSSSSKAILNKKQTFCPPSDWWHSTFSAFFFENNALWQLCFVVQVARNFYPTCTRIFLRKLKEMMKCHQFWTFCAYQLLIVSKLPTPVENEKCWWFSRSIFAECHLELMLVKNHK